MKTELSAVLSGVGVSQVGRRLGRDPIDMTFDACASAIADAGLEPGDIDGLATYPGANGSTPGISGAGIDDVRSMFGLRTRWHAGGPELAGQLGTVVNAVLAVAAGLCEHVLCFRSVWESTAQTQIGSRAGSGCPLEATRGAMVTTLRRRLCDLRWSGHAALHA